MHKRKPRSFFDKLDKNRDGFINVWEFYAPFARADRNKDFNVSPEEFLRMLMKNERTMCRPFEPMIDRVIKMKNKMMKRRNAPFNTPKCYKWQRMVNRSQTKFTKYIGRNKPAGKCYAEFAKIRAYVFNSEKRLLAVRSE